jgi:CMP/dCMP kinase
LALSYNNEKYAFHKTIKMSFKEKLLDPTQKIVVAIDGVSASGKGTLAKLMAKRFNLLYCQTSIFYRQLAYDVIEAGIENDIEKIITLSAKPFILREGIDLYSPKVTDITSKIAAIPEVRNNLRAPQRDFLESHDRVVMEGRDIGTVIAPDADLKIFITADVEVRAQRRVNQMIESGQSAELQDVVASLIERDERDSTRSESPLVKADDAIEIDSSGISPDEIINLLVE